MIAFINIYDSDDDEVDHFIHDEDGNYNLSVESTAKILNVDIVDLNKFISSAEVFKANSVVTRISNRRVLK